MNLGVSRRFMRIWGKRDLTWCNNICMKFSNARKIMSDWKKWATSQKYRGATNSHYELKISSFKGNTEWIQIYEIWIGQSQSKNIRCLWISGFKGRKYWQVHRKLHVVIIMTLCICQNLTNYNINVECEW